MSSVTKKQLEEKDRQTIFAKEIVTKNPVFSQKQIEDFFALFNAYCDNRRECDVQDILTTAKTLGFDKNFKLVYDALVLVSHELDGEWVHFERFLTLLTAKVGHVNSEQGRRQIFELLDVEGKDKLTFSDLRKISDAMKYKLSDDEIQDVIRTVTGSNKKDITWDQFNAYLTSKVEKKNLNA